MLGLEHEHVLAELLPVAGGFPQRPIQQLRRPDLDVARGIEAAPDIGLDRAIEDPAFWMPERRTRGLFLEMEQIERLAQPAVISALGLLQAMEVLVELLAGRPGGAVDALEHGVAAVAPPVGPGHLEQLEGADPPGGRAVRPAAQIEPAVLVVERDRLPLGDVVEQLDLVVLALRLEPAPGVLAAHDLAAKRLVRRDDLGHAGLDPLQILGMERLVTREVVVEPVLDRRADGHLGARVQILDRLGHDVGAVVAQDRQRRLVLGS